MLLMKKAYFEAIRAGRKTTTLRYWKHRRVRPGSEHTVPGLGRVRIESVREVSLEQLTEADARSDGFESLADLRKALAECYDQTERSRRALYLVSFTYPVGPGKGANRTADSVFSPAPPADG